MFRFSPSEFFCSICEGGNDISLLCVSMWGSPWFMSALCGVGTAVTGEPSSCRFRMLAVVNTSVLHERSAVCVRLEFKLNLVHVSSQVEPVMFFLRHLQPHFKVKPEKHKGEDFRHWFARPVLTRGIIMCCGKLTRLPEAACVKILNFLVAPYGEGTELSLEKISFSS